MWQLLQWSLLEIMRWASTALEHTFAKRMFCHGEPYIPHPANLLGLHGRPNSKSLALDFNLILPNYTNLNLESVSVNELGRNKLRGCLQTHSDGVLLLTIIMDAFVVRHE